MIQLPNAVKAYFSASNEERLDSLMAAFDEDAYVFDDNREFRGIEAIRHWCESDILGARVRFEVTDATEQDGTYAVIASIDGDFDKTNLPSPFLLKHTFKLSAGKIQELHIALPSFGKR
ncbi:nuclear transport factor 2 family protein [Cohnella rhizosphaerae]|uniref:Nuclear transport factor 2 family protein n=1 Tax=Cohnella rhizosphaerae TaxID=1457232 RepID=A0A9X4QWP3_9BACL|nr:nuclear transport factor 2 family protein [Cohnella rhizosphaerae]MDG0812562.1 nuclear transport factor 2 family protein [Cohnella rhizosphaerae]